MRYHHAFTLKDGRQCVLRNATEADGQSVLECFIRTHEETDWLLTLPEETRMTAEEEARYLAEKAASDRSVELVAEVQGKIVGTAGFEAVGSRVKVKHRAEFGISIEREYWGLGIGRALTAACIECAGEAGYIQLELEVVAENTRAIALYRRMGFAEYGRNPMGFRSPLTGWQELTLMRLELENSGSKFYI